MKKYLLTICGLAMIATLVSCGDNKKGSSASESTSVIGTTATETTAVTTTAIQRATEESYKDEEITLDSNLECDYLKVATCSEWQEKSKIEGDKFQVYWDWGDIDNGPYFFINLELNKSMLGNMSQLDLQEYYEGLFEYCKENNEEINQSVLRSFSKNGQAYIILVSKKDLLRTIHFSTDIVNGYFTYSSECEDIVMDMIDSIEFKESAVITAETSSEKLDEPKTEKTCS